MPLSTELLPPSCCCQDPQLAVCELCSPTAYICCFVLSCSHWTKTLLLKRNSGTCVEDPPENATPNHCGSLNSGGVIICGHYAVMNWVVSDDCTTISMSVSVNFPNTHPAAIPSSGATFTGLTHGWENSTYTWSESRQFRRYNWVGGVWTSTDTTETVTYTLQKCTTGTEIYGGLDYYTLPQVWLKYIGRQTNQDTGEVTEGSSIGVGNRWTGQPCLYEGLYPRLAWCFNIWTGRIDFGANLVGVYVLGGSSTWYGDLYDTIYYRSVIVPGFGFGPDMLVEEFVIRVEDCDDPYLPPACVPYACFPGCLVKYCDPDVNASALFLNVSSLNGCCLDGSYDLTWDGSAYYSGLIGDLTLSSCGYVEIWYECSGDTFRRRVKVTDVNGNVSETTQDDPGACVDHPPTGEEFEDTFDLQSGIFSPLCFNVLPFFADTVTFDVFTNNGGGP